MSIEDMTDDELFNPSDDNSEAGQTEQGEQNKPSEQATENEQGVSDNEQAQANTVTDDVGSDNANIGEPKQAETEPSVNEQDISKQLEAEFAQLKADLGLTDDDFNNSDDDGSPVAPILDDFDIETEEGLNAYFQAQAEYEQEYSVWQTEQQYQQFAQRFAEEQEAKQREQQISQQFEQAFKANPKFKEDFTNLQKWATEKPVKADPSSLYQGQDLMDILAEVASSADTYYQLAGMSEQQQYAKFGEIHARVQARKQQTNNQGQGFTKAPKPPTHGGSTAPTKRSEYDMSDDEFLEARGLA